MRDGYRLERRILDKLWTKRMAADLIGEPAKKNAYHDAWHIVLHRRNNEASCPTCTPVAQRAIHEARDRDQVPA